MDVDTDAEAGETTTGTDRTATGNSGEPAWYEDWPGPAILLVYLVVTIASVSVSATEFRFAESLAGAYLVVAGWIRTVLTGLGATASVPTAPAEWLSTPAAQPGLATTIPIDIYLFGLAGAFTRFLLGFVTDVGSLTRPVTGGRGEGGSGGDGSGTADGSGDGDGTGDGGPGDVVGSPADWTEPDASELELLRLLLAVPAAVYLAAGVYLVSTQVGGLLQGVDAVALSVIVSFVVGFYVRRSYALLGDVADRLLAPVDEDANGNGERAERGSMLARTLNLPTPAESGAADGRPTADARPVLSGRPWYAGWWGRTLFAVAVLVGVGVLLALLDGGVPSSVATTVPPDVYLYAGMGGIGYVFTKLFVDVNRSLRSVVESSVRVFAGVFLAVGIYLLFDPSVGAVPAVAFLVGLYLNVAVMRFDALAERVFGRLSRAIRRDGSGTAEGGP